MKTNTEETIDAFLSRAVENIFPNREFVEARLKEGKPLTMYVGVDPTGPTLHMGHAIWLRKLREWQDMGHKAIMLIGDFTATIGDPTDKNAARKQLSREEVLANCKKYKEQASRFLRFDGENPAELQFNSEWSSKLTAEDLVRLGAYFTVNQLLERDMFQRRMEESKPIYFSELMYPIMQGYDSVAMDVDGEMGGNDQTFNMLAGRDLMKAMRGKEKFVVALKLLVDTTGKKMGKSEGNMITFEDSPEDMFGKVMSWTDGMIVAGFELATDVSTAEIAKISKSLIRDEVNPRDVKAKLAWEIVKSFHAQAAADEAREAFDKLFKKHETPEDVPVFNLPSSTFNILDLLVQTNLAPSKAEAKRLIDGGGIKVDGHVIEGYDVELIPTKEGVLVQKGKRHFVRVITSV
jgi:tyrosyl-tRNA synthetase